MTKPPATVAFSRVLLAAVLLLGAGCSPLDVAWRTTAETIEMTALGPKNAVLLILAGPATGPHFIANAPEIWSTVGPGPGVERIALDASGTATKRFAIKDLPKTPLLLQVVAVTADAPVRALGVSSCMALRWEDGRPMLRPHAVEVLLSPTSYRFLLVAAIFVAVWFARRLEIVSGPGRAWRAVLVLLAAALLLWTRYSSESAAFPAARGIDPPPLLVPGGAAGRLPRATPLDRVTRVGFSELVRSARRIGEKAGIAIVVDPKAPADEYHATQARWLLLPVRSDLVAPGAEAPSPEAVNLSFAITRERPGIEILFQNTAGVVWRKKAAESR